MVIRMDVWSRELVVGRLQSDGKFRLRLIIFTRSRRSHSFPLL